MTPLVIGLAIVVVIILIAVAVGVRHVRNTERADFDDRPPESGTTWGQPAPGRARDRQRPRPGQPPARTVGLPRSGPGRNIRRPAAASGFDHGEDEPDFRTAQRPEARRQARGRRDDDGDWPTTEWDELSDADYWKEVASDRPLVTTARVAQPGTADAGLAARPAGPRVAQAARHPASSTVSSTVSSGALRNGMTRSGRATPQRGRAAARRSRP